MTDPSEWAGEVSAGSDPCLQDFDIFSLEMAKVYGDEDRPHVAVITLMQEYIELPQQLVRAYANRVKANRRLAGWDLQMNEEVLYDIGWAGLCNCFKNKIVAVTPARGRFDRLDEFCDKAAASEVTHVEKKKPQQQRQQQQTQPTDWSSKGRHQGYWPSILEPAATTGSGKSGQLGSNKLGKSGGRGQSSGLPPAPRVTTEISEGRRSTGKCLLSGSPNPRQASALNTHEEVTHRNSRTRH